MNTERIAALGHELQIGDYVMFPSCGNYVIGIIKDFIYDKAVCYPTGWRGAPEFKDKIRKQYKIKCTNCFLMIVKKNK